MKWSIFGALTILGLTIFFLSGNETSEEVMSEDLFEEKVFVDPVLPVKKIEEPASDVLKSADPSLTEEKLTASGLAKLDTEGTSSDIPLTEQEMEELEEYFERIEEEWADTLENLFKNELQLTKEAIEQYENLREGFEEEKLAAFQEYHEQMVAKHGDNYAYRPGQDETIFEKKVLEEYYDRLRKSLGDDVFNRYTEVRERFNERIKSEQDPDKGLLIIDY